MRPKEFGQLIKKEEIPPVIFFFGDEDYWKELYLKMLCSRLFKNKEIVFHFFSTSVLKKEVREVIDQANEISFFGNQKIIHYTEIDRLNAEEWKCLKEYLDCPNPSTILILDTFESELSKGMNELFLSSVPQVLFEIKKNNRLECKEFIEFKLREMGNLILEKGLEDCLLDAFPSNLRMLASNLEKMAAHRGYVSPLTREDFRVVNPLLGDMDTFKFLDAVVEKKFYQAIKNRTHFFRQKDLIFLLMGSLRSYFEKLLTAKVMKRQQIASSEIDTRCKVSTFPSLREKFWRQCDHLSEEELGNKYALIALCDYQLKSTGISPYHLFEMLIYNLCR
jgi:DNA polymerase III delta subunit